MITKQRQKSQDKAKINYIIVQITTIEHIKKSNELTILCKTENSHIKSRFLKLEKQKTQNFSAKRNIISIPYFVAIKSCYLSLLSALNTMEQRYSRA